MYKLYSVIIKAIFCYHSSLSFPCHPPPLSLSSFFLWLLPTCCPSSSASPSPLHVISSASAFPLPLSGFFFLCFLPCLLCSSASLSPPFSYLHWLVIYPPIQFLPPSLLLQTPLLSTSPLLSLSFPFPLFLGEKCPSASLFLMAAPTEKALEKNLGIHS